MRIQKNKCNKFLCKFSLKNLKLTMSSTKLDMNYLKQIQDTTKNLIFGYVRNIKNMLLITNQLFHNIPELVSYIILLYFYQQEFFAISGKYTTLSQYNIW